MQKAQNNKVTTIASSSECSRCRHVRLHAQAAPNNNKAAEDDTNATADAPIRPDWCQG